jgi:threonine aldolase
MTIVDLRSDTVTRPTAAMKRAMTEAELGDDVFGDDPTVKRLEARVAELAGMEAAVYVPSGTMGNQIAVKCHTEPGERVVLGDEAHIYLYEQGGIAANSGCLAHTLTVVRGCFDLAALERTIEPEDEHIARASLLCVENTHNRHGGAIVPLDHLRALHAFTRANRMRLHLDGARLWNASVATGIPIREWTANADTVMMCFSKGLGTPVGSILVGSASLIHRARRVRKRWGGAMRQVGVLAGACLHALDHHVDRLADDHRRARTLAKGFRAAPGVSVTEPETNILYVTLEHPSLDAPALLQRLGERGVRLSQFGPRLLRAITHLDVDDAGITRAVESFQSAVSESLAQPARN